MAARRKGDDIPFDPTWKSPHEIERQKVRFAIAKGIGLYRDCDRTGCKRNRTCLKPDKTPCYWKHFRAMKEAGIFDMLREAVERETKGAKSLRRD